MTQPRRRDGKFAGMARSEGKPLDAPVGLQDEDLQRVTEKFGVPVEQVIRDHAISHVLAGISASNKADVIFFGGTALSRTHITEGRLSEDIDLIAIGNREEACRKINETVERSLVRIYGRVSWRPRFDPNDDVTAAVAVTSDSVQIKIQLLNRQGYEPWPTEERSIEQRYSDVHPASLVVPTRDAFIGWKTASWLDRAASRDLYDLNALAESGGYTSESVGCSDVTDRRGCRRPHGCSKRRRT